MRGIFKKAAAIAAAMALLLMPIAAYAAGQETGFLRIECAPGGMPGGGSVTAVLTGEDGSSRAAGCSAENGWKTSLELPAGTYRACAFAGDGGDAAGLPALGLSTPQVVIVPDGVCTLTVYMPEAAGAAAPAWEGPSAAARESAMTPEETAAALAQESTAAPVQKDTAAPVQETAMVPVQETAAASVQDSTAAAPVQEESAEKEDRKAGKQTGSMPLWGVIAVCILMVLALSFASAICWLQDADGAGIGRERARSQAAAVFILNITLGLAIAAALYFILS